MRNDAIDAIVFHYRTDARDVAKAVDNPLADLAIALHLGFLILRQKELQRRHQADNLLLGGLRWPANPLIRAGIEGGGPNQVLTSGEDAGALRATDALATAEVHQVCPLLQILAQVLARWQHRRRIDDDRHAMTVGDLADFFQRKNARRAGERGWLIRHGGSL